MLMSGRLCACAERGRCDLKAGDKPMIRVQISLGLETFVSEARVYRPEIPWAELLPRLAWLKEEKGGTRNPYPYGFRPSLRGSVAFAHCSIVLHSDDFRMIVGSLCVTS